VVGLLGGGQVRQPGQQRQPAGPRALVGLPLLLHVVLGLVIGEDAQVGEEGLQHGLLHRNRRAQRDRLPHPARRCRRHNGRYFRVRRRARVRETPRTASPPHAGPCHVTGGGGVT